MLTIKDIRKQWRVLIPEFKNLDSNIFFQINKYHLSGIELVKLPNKIKKYSIYYQICSLLTPLKSPKDLNPIINYGILNKKDIRLNVSLEQSEEEHYQFIKDNLSLIKAQFVFHESAVQNHAEGVLLKLDDFLERSIFDQNKISVYVFMVQLSHFAGKAYGNEIHDKYVDKIAAYNVLPSYYPIAYNKSKDEFMACLRDRRTHRIALENTIAENRLLLDNYIS